MVTLAFIIPAFKTEPYLPRRFDIAAAQTGSGFKWSDEVGVGSFGWHGYSLDGLVYFLLGVHIQNRGGLSLHRGKASAVLFGGW